MQQNLITAAGAAVREAEEPKEVGDSWAKRRLAEGVLERKFTNENYPFLIMKTL